LKRATFDGEFPAGKAEKGPNLVRTTKVDAYAPNQLGLYDMHGNVCQWCADFGDAKGTTRVVRGGSWYGPGHRCRAAQYWWHAPSERYYNLGFRLARVQSGGKQ
jgi:formylglycine-generating enzyme required for sulfatase activity